MITIIIIIILIIKVEIEHKEKNKQELNIINKIPYKGQLYNPINMSVYDKDNLMLKDSKEYNKINRYQCRCKCCM